MSRVLVADDQTDILQALRLLLTDVGYDVDLVASVGGVLERVTPGSHDLLLMDLNYTRDTTSGREGLELIDGVRRRDEGLPIVVMTGWGSIETAVDAMRRGAKSFVQKPWDDSTLVDIVTREIEDGRATRRKDHALAREHEEARLIQRTLLPLAMPQMSGCVVAAQWTPALGLGGDCYDVMRFSDTRAGVSIADVVGKSLPAALLMSNLQAAVRAFATDGADPRDVCGRVNRLLCRNIASGKFVTFCYVLIDTATGALTFANAGHNPPILVRASGCVERLDPTGLVLGIAPDWDYQSGTCAIGPGDRLVCFTDGITEAMSPTGEEFGDDRLIALAVEHRADGADTLTHRLSDAARQWTAGDAQDDATLIVVAVG
jgi:serine phosphatase RsbU (regulator of sigma subunit)